VAIFAIIMNNEWSSINRFARIICRSLLSNSLQSDSRLVPSGWSVDQWRNAAWIKRTRLIVCAKRPGRTSPPNCSCTGNCQAGISTEPWPPGRGPSRAGPTGRLISIGALAEHYRNCPETPDSGTCDVIRDLSSEWLGAVRTTPPSPPLSGGTTHVTVSPSTSVLFHNFQGDLR